MICRAHKGETGVISTLGQGSTFWFEVQLGIATTEAELESVSVDADGDRRPLSTDQLATLKVMVVDDVASNRKMIQRLLDRKGVRVTCAKNGQEAVCVATKEPMDLILMYARAKPYV
jgi:PleD family two-component response regulator